MDHLCDGRVRTVEAPTPEGKSGLFYYQNVTPASGADLGIVPSTGTL